jgi:post-segregation antitoxin (ccd killing protein)
MELFESLHKELAARAKAEGVNISELVERLLAHAVEQWTHPKRKGGTHRRDYVIPVALDRRIAEYREATGCSFKCLLNTALRYELDRLNEEP